ncbi:MULTISPECIES: polyketide cyclase [Saccharibacillus]|uniref:polyketide cyclase n=1 Tax=Saccharibacillus TaxID=456492 RepID=UPI00123A2055|nr:polyketide cyclase [Saccharibacillus sp. WB 17]MWJ31963.1 polyketide cyclase [Saccharibacillus sp. WB 17]
MNGYRFVSDWMLETSTEALWTLIEEPEQADWWRGCCIRKIKSGPSGDGIGDEYLTVIRSRMLYKLSFTARIVEKRSPNLIELRADGHLEGSGRLEFEQVGDCTRVRYTWEVRTKKRWMNLWAPFFRPAFVWNHNRVMADCIEGLTRRLGVRLVQPGMAE